jgi:hypothetical protein
MSVSTGLRQHGSALRRGAHNDFANVDIRRLLDGKRNSTSNGIRCNRSLVTCLDDLGFHLGICHGFREVRRIPLLAPVMMTTLPLIPDMEILLNAKPIDE